MTFYEDTSLPHQIRVDFEEQHGEIFVTCNCQRGTDGRYTPLTEPGGTHRQRIDAYKAHLEKVNGP